MFVEEGRSNCVVKVREIESIPRCTWIMGEETGGKTLAILVAKDGSLRTDVDRRPQEDHGRVHFQACRSFHEGAGVREERGDIEDRRRTGVGGDG